MNYYNEFDTKTAAWLRELISAKLIPAGDVDTRSIVDVSADELRGYTQCHFFAGIGGWSLALQLAGWPADKPVWSLSCPCQPFSTAGKGLGAADERHLWPVAFNLIKECRPPVVFGEQVASSAVVGKRSEMDALQQMRRKQAILRFLSGEKSQTQVILQGLQEQANQPQKERELFSGQDRQKGAHFGWRSEIQGQKNESSIRFGCGGDSFQNRDRSVRVDRNTIRSGDAESMEQPIIGSDKASSGIHQGQCESSSVFCKCDESQLGAEVYSGSCGCNTRTAQEEIERLIGEIGGESEEAPIVWIDGVQDDLEKIDYTFGSCVMAASSVGAPHIRQRLYWVAHSMRSGQQRQGVVGRPSDSTEKEDREINRTLNAGRSSCGSSASDRLADTESIRSGEGQQDARGSVSGGDEEQGAVSVCGSSVSGMADTELCGCKCQPQQRSSSILPPMDEQRESREPACPHSPSPHRPARPDDHWSNCTIIPCRDGKARRIPAQAIIEPVFQHVLDGFSCSLDARRNILSAAQGFPLTETIPARVILLKGAGNAIVPAVAAEFIQAFQETQAATA